MSLDSVTGIHYRWWLQLHPRAELVLPPSLSVDTGVKTQSRSNRNRTANLMGTIINSFLLSLIMTLQISDGYLDTCVLFICFERRV